MLGRRIFGSAAPLYLLILSFPNSFLGTLIVETDNLTFLLIDIKFCEIFQVYCKIGHLRYNFAGNTKNMMETERIKSPKGVRKLMAELWANHVNGARQCPCRVFLVDLPEPNEDEKRIMATNRANRKPFVLDEETLKGSLVKAVGELRGW